MRQMRPQAFRVEVGRSHEYERAKRLLDAGKHPAFVGRSLVERCARNGGLLFFVAAAQDAAVAVVNPKNNSLIVLNVHPGHRGTGIGEAVLGYIKPNFVRAVESAVPWFEARGYTPIGTWKQGRSLRTRVLVRSRLIGLAGRLRDKFERNADHRSGGIGVAPRDLGRARGGEVVHVD